MEKNKNFFNYTLKQLNKLLKSKSIKLSNKKLNFFKCLTFIGKSYKVIDIIDNNFKEKSFPFEIEIFLLTIKKLFSSINKLLKKTDLENTKIIDFPYFQFCSLLRSFLENLWFTLNQNLVENGLTKIKNIFIKAKELILSNNWRVKTTFTLVKDSYSSSKLEKIYTFYFNKENNLIKIEDNIELLFHFITKSIKIDKKTSTLLKNLFSNTLILSLNKSVHLGHLLFWNTIKVNHNLTFNLVLQALNSLTKLNDIVLYFLKIKIHFNLNFI